MSAREWNTVRLRVNGNNDKRICSCFIIFSYLVYRLCKQTNREKRIVKIVKRDGSNNNRNNRNKIININLNDLFTQIIFDVFLCFVWFVCRGLLSRLGWPLSFFLVISVCNLRRLTTDWFQYILFRFYLLWVNWFDWQYNK